MIVFLALGSNIGDRSQYLEQAIAALQKLEGITVVSQSSVYETAAVGYTDQPDFLNMVIKIETTLSAEILLETVLSVEKDLGRVRENKWGPRTIDIDILFYGKLIHRSENLIIPHPFLQERAFVLMPLEEIAADWVHPVTGLTVGVMTEKVLGKEGVRLWEKHLAKDYVHFENLKI